MKRKYLYGLLLAPILIFGVMAIAMPTFRTEFVHNVRGMLGIAPPQYGDGSKGLRSEHPDEYGGGYASPDETEEGAEASEGDAAAPDATDATELDATGSDADATDEASTEPAEGEAEAVEAAGAE